MVSHGYTTFHLNTNERNIGAHYMKDNWNMHICFIDCRYFYCEFNATFKSILNRKLDTVVSGRIRNVAYSVRILSETNECVV